MMDASSSLRPGDAEPAPDSADVRDAMVHGRLFELYDQMLGEVNTTKLLYAAAEVVRQILNAERATIYLVIQDTQELESAAIIGNVSRRIRVPIGEDSLAGFCALTRRSFVIPDAYGDLSHVDRRLRLDRSWDRINQFRTRDVMCVPALFRDEVMGVVQVINCREGTFREEDLRSLEGVSRLVAYALYHARLYDELATMKKLEQEKADFMRILVHEMRSPAASVKTLVSGLQYLHRDNASLTGVLDPIGKRMDRLLLLVEDILHLSRIKAGRPLGEITTCDLAHATNVVCREYLAEAGAKGLAMEIRLPGEPVSVRIDVQGYRLILSNLVSNAVKYTPIGSVKVSLRAEPPWAVLEVADTGMGIPQEDIPRLFTEFFRASNTRESEIPGTGVGLAGAKELVERFRGHMELASEVNVGSMFTVRLPLSDGARSDSFGET